MMSRSDEPSICSPGHPLPNGKRLRRKAIRPNSIEATQIRNIVATLSSEHGGREPRAAVEPMAVEVEDDPSLNCRNLLLSPGRGIRDNHTYPPQPPSV